MYDNYISTQASVTESIEPTQKNSPITISNFLSDTLPVVVLEFHLEEDIGVEGEVCPFGASTLAHCMEYGSHRCGQEISALSCSQKT